ncbi:MAG: hypothetical protein ACUVWJ_01430 [Spirochaetota bacterium]
MKQSKKIMFKKSISIIKKNSFSPFSMLPFPDESFFQSPVIKRGKGPYLYDYDENRYVDFFLGDGSLLLGHAHPGITKVVKSWLGRGYSQGYPNAAKRLLVAHLRSFFGAGKDTTIPDAGRWCFFDSAYEASASLLTILNSSGSHGRGCYITCWGGKRVSPFFRPYIGSILVPLSMDDVKPERLEGYGYFILRCGRLSEKNSFNRLVEMLKDRGKPIVSDESNFPSHVHLSKQIESPVILDARFFGSWLCGGLSFGCLLCRESLFSAFLENEKMRQKKMSGLENYDTSHGLTFLESLHNVAGLPPLFRVKAALRFLQLFKKSDGVEGLSGLNRYFFSLLDTRYFELIDDTVYLKNGIFSAEGFMELRHLMLERGLYVPLSLHEPFSISLAHDYRLLSKCAAVVNSITEAMGI